MAFAALDTVGSVKHRRSLSEVFDELPSVPGPPDSGEGTVSRPGRRTVCRKTTSSEQRAREFARASGRLAKTAAIDAAKDCSGPRYRNKIVALQLRMLGNSLNGNAPKTEASEKVRSSAGFITSAKCASMSLADLLNGPFRPSIVKAAYQ